MSSRDEDVGHFEIPDPVEESTVSLVSSSTSAYASFPVDVVVYVRVQVRAEPVRFTEQVPSSSSEPSSVLLFRVFFPRGRGPCLSVTAGRSPGPPEVYVPLHVCISAEEGHRALGFQNSNPIHLWQK